MIISTMTHYCLLARHNFFVVLNHCPPYVPDCNMKILRAYSVLWLWWSAFMRAAQPYWPVQKWNTSVLPNWELLQAKLTQPRKDDQFAHRKRSQLEEQMHYILWTGQSGLAGQFWQFISTLTLVFHLQVSPCIYASCHLPHLPQAFVSFSRFDINNCWNLMLLYMVGI